MEKNFINYNDNWNNAGGLFGGRIKQTLGVGTGAGTGLFGGRIKQTLGVGTGAGTGLFGGKIKQTLGIGDGKVFGKVVNPTKNAQFEANKYITSGQAAIDEQKAIDDKKALDVVEEAKAKAEAEAAKNEIEKGTIDINKTNSRVSSVTPDATKSNLGLYIGIGGGILAIGIIAFLVMRKK